VSIVESLLRAIGWRQRVGPTIPTIPDEDIPPHLVRRKQRLENVIRQEARLIEELRRAQ